MHLKTVAKEPVIKIDTLQHIYDQPEWVKQQICGPAPSGGLAQHEIAPGVVMPSVNLGGVSSRPSNYSAFLAMGGVGLGERVCFTFDPLTANYPPDTALAYGKATQASVGDAIKQSGLPRRKIFLTT